jgi:hypothetical protein
MSQKKNEQSESSRAGATMSTSVNVVFMACHLGVYELQIADPINRPSIDGAWAE